MKFPNLTLEDKKNLEGGGNDGNPPRRSTRIRDQATAMANMEGTEPEEDHGGPVGQVSGLG